MKYSRKRNMMFIFIYKKNKFRINKITRIDKTLSSSRKKIFQRNLISRR